MTLTPFVQRMRQLDEARQRATSLSEKIRLDDEMAQLIAMNHRGEPIEPPEEPFDFKQAQTGERDDETV